MNNLFIIIHYSETTIQPTIAIMKSHHSPPSALGVTLVSLLALVSAMGVGRFAFTPLFPLMQAQGGLSLSQGAWLASANYIGYLLGALACSMAPPPPRSAVRGGLVAVALSTLAMGLTDLSAAWLALRFAAGVASACVLVGVSAWALPALGALGRSAWAGWVFCGVGVGIGLAGLAGLIVGIGGYPPAQAWLALGAISAVVAVIAWRSMGKGEPPGVSALKPSGRLGAGQWRLVFCYATLGFGYIIPATFLPAMARGVINDPAVFGWIWPAFGATAAASTVLVALCFRRVSARNIWAPSHLVMATGVLAPVLKPGVWTLLVAAVCVGGTFMVTTMAGMQEARRLAGARAPQLMAAMTAAFALGQLGGALLVGLAAQRGVQDLTGASLLAAALLVLGAWFLRLPEPVIAPPKPENERDPT